MIESKLKQDSISFAIEIVNYYHWLTQERKEFILSTQILRSGTSIGANIHEAGYASSRADFIVKMQIALKEAAETEYWMIVLEQTGYSNHQFDSLKQQIIAIKKMLVATLNTAKK